MRLRVGVVRSASMSTSAVDLVFVTRACGSLTCSAPARPGVIDDGLAGRLRGLASCGIDSTRLPLHWLGS